MNILNRHHTVYWVVALAFAGVSSLLWLIFKTEGWLFFVSGATACLAAVSAYWGYHGFYLERHDTPNLLWVKAYSYWALSLVVAIASFFYWLKTAATGLTPDYESVGRIAVLAFGFGLVGLMHFGVSRSVWLNRG